MYKIIYIVILSLYLQASEDLLKRFIQIQNEEKNIIIKNFKEEQNLILHIKTKVFLHTKRYNTGQHRGLHYNQEKHNNENNINNNHNPQRQKGKE